MALKKVGKPTFRHRQYCFPPLENHSIIKELGWQGIPTRSSLNPDSADSRLDLDHLPAEVP